MGNIKSYISRHNAKVRNNKQEQTPETRTCNCRKKKNENTGKLEAKCPLQGKCLTESVVYQAEIKVKDKDNKDLPTKIYYGLTERTFKESFNEHQSSFNPNTKEKKDGEKEKKTSTLATYVLKCKKKGLNPIITWSIKSRAHAYSSGSRQCDLCLTEKTTILHANPAKTLNRRDELLSKCTHKRKYTLGYTTKKKGPPQPD